MATDAHCHLQDERFGGEIGPVMERAGAAGVTHLMCCATREEDWEAVERLGRRYEQVAVSFGVHPWYAGTTSEGWRERLEERLGRSWSAVGEIGLDFVVKQPDRETQERAFLAQLEAAKKAVLPVSIHCRGAWGRMVEILEGARLSAGGLIHSYSGGVELLGRLGRLGFHISFSGTVTRPNNKRGRAAAAAVPPHMLLIESDCPDLPPDGLQGTLNEPVAVCITAAAVAELREVSVDETFALTTRNFKSLFAGALAHSRL